MPSCLTGFIPPSSLLLERATAAKWEAANSEPNINYCDFMDMLGMSTIYYGYMALANPSVPNSEITRYFWPALSVMNREHMMLYFAAIFHAKVSQQSLNHPWTEIPFFQLGGNGTHCFKQRSPGSIESENRSRKYPRVILSTADIPEGVDANVHDDWFEMRELEIYLREKNVSFHMSAGVRPTKTRKRCLPVISVDIHKFIRGQCAFPCFYNGQSVNI